MKNHLKKKKEYYKKILKELKSLISLKIEFNTAGWSSLVARQAHNLKVGGSNPSPATNLMIKNILKDYSEIKNNDKLFFLTFSLFPISLILGNLVINVFISLFSLSFLFNLKRNPFLKNKITYLLLFFFYLY